MIYRTNLALALIVAVCVYSTSAFADTVNNDNIATFIDNQPALANEVNGNFDELISQINDHASRIATIEANGLVAGISLPAVDCAVDQQGPSGLRDTLNNARNTTDLIIITASGVCDGFGLFSTRRVLITTPTNGTLTIKGDTVGLGSTVFVQNSELILSPAANGVITVDGNGGPNAVRTGSYGIVNLRGAVNISGAANGGEQVALFQNSQLLCSGTCTIGSNNDGATGILLRDSLMLLVSINDNPNATLNINSSGAALFMDNSALKTSESVPGLTQLNIPNANGIELINHSKMVMGPAAIAITGGRFRITDHSIVSSNSALFDAGQTSSLATDILLDRSSTLRLNFEEAPSDISVTQTGSLEVGVNSNLEAFGVSGEPATLTMGAGNGTEASVVVGSTAIFNSATFASDSTTVLDATLIFGGFARLDNTPPSLEVTYNGMILDFVDDGSGSTDVATFSSDIARCSTGGIAYDTSGTEACIIPPP